EVDGQSAFARVIARKCDPAPVAGDAAQSGNLPVPYVGKAARRLVQPGHRSQQVDLHHLVVFRKVVLMRSDWWLSAGDVDDEVQAAQVGGNLLEEGRHSAEICHVV